MLVTDATVQFDWLLIDLLINSVKMTFFIERIYSL